MQNEISLPHYLLGDLELHGLLQPAITATGRANQLYRIAGLRIFIGFSVVYTAATAKVAFIRQCGSIGKCSLQRIQPCSDSTVTSIGGERLVHLCSIDRV